MQIVLFCHSLLSDWNHGNAHFLRGVVAELVSRGHRVTAYEPRDAWSARNLVADHGEAALGDVQVVYPALDVVRYDGDRVDLDAALDSADLVLVHEWNDPELVARIGRKRATGGAFRLLFHDTHHRSVTDPDAMRRYDLSAYDGVLAFGEAVREIYLDRGWAHRVWTWHEAADTRIFRPLARPRQGELVWVGNWGDEERTAELEEFLIGPVRRLGLRTRVHGVRYPAEARRALSEAGIEYAGWLPNHRVPEVFASYRMTVHVPRRPYARALPGIPTIRIFEALACGIPLISAPWDDTEGLFRPGIDYLVARDGDEAARHLSTLILDPVFARALSESGLRRIRSRHTCAHRVDELLAICDALEVPHREHAASPSYRAAGGGV